MSSLGIFNKETKTYQKVAGTAEAVVLDTAMSDTSTNPVQNKVIKKYVDEHAANITVDSAMSDESINPVQNKVIKKYVDDKSIDKLDKTSVINNQLASEAGYVLDARQANPNIDGSLGAKIQHVQYSAVKASVTNIFIKNSLHVTASNNVTVSATAYWAGDELMVSIPSVPAGKTNISINLSMPANSHVILNAFGTNGQNIVYNSGCIFSNNTSNNKNINFPFDVIENKTGGHVILIKVLIISGI